MFRTRAAVQKAVPPALEQGGQATDQKYRVPRGKGFSVLPRGGARRRKVKSSGPLAFDLNLERNINC